MASSYSIVSQKQNVEMNAQGTGFQHVWEVTYKVTSGPSKGTVGTVSVPEEDHNATYVDNAISTKIGQLDAVASLGGTS
jgi:hypothetical protein